MSTVRLGVGMMEGMVSVGAAVKVDKGIKFSWGAIVFKSRDNPSQVPLTAGHIESLLHLLNGCH